MKQNNDKIKEKIDPLEEVINLMLKSQAKTCIRAKKILEEKEKNSNEQLSSSFPRRRESKVDCRKKKA
ncbi:MAG: hypothetical protein UT64_C0036G0009 [Candidatus Falkowbacteria bacterium GW2011_GWF2_39_8]|uniref:Uncharacterized protein n=1 Tax=Candidatus Falkowbacteria bacterium GW2011_GWF2_39_8 TaxID=1618642 RepID=A0A0G0T3E4_9BACT|nr:MAG: hypothetical protein UT64_C0036G0009 [Candidatus Falkowbacteria bacterium GW2011_GWF2_39_8]